MKINILLLSLLICVSTSAFASSSDLTIGSVSASPGQTISVPIMVDLNTPIFSNQFTIQYDQTLLTPTTVVLGSGDNGWSIFFNANNPGTLIIGMFGVTSISGSQQIAVMNFTVKPGTPADLTSNITVSKVVFDTASITSLTNGVVTLSLPGDVNMDGQVTFADATLVAQDAIGLTNLTPADITLADVSGDGTVTMYDAALIAEYAAGVINKFH